MIKYLLFTLIIAGSLSWKKAGDNEKLIKPSAATLKTQLKVAFIGDSFTQINLYQDSVVKLNNFIKVFDDGVGGSCIASGTTDAEGDGYHRMSIYDRFNNALATGADVIVLEGGSNDWYYSINPGQSTSLDSTEYSGALNKIKQKWQRYADAHRKAILVMINLMQRGGLRKNGQPSDFSSEENYANIPKELFKGRHIYVCDAFHNSGITFNNIKDYTVDNVHPNAAGKVIYSGYVASFIKSVVKQ